MKAFSLALVWLKPAFLRSKIVNQDGKKQVSENITISTSSACRDTGLLESLPYPNYRYGTYDGEVYRFSVRRLICNQGAKFYLK